jgi:hypothetical protein
MRIAHADRVHLVERVVNVVDARAALPDALRDQARAPVQVELAHVGRVLRVGEKCERVHLTTRAQAYRNEPRLINAARHFAIPETRQRMTHAPRLDAKRHPPARSAGAQSHHQARLALRAPVARRQNAKRAVEAVHPAERLVRVVEAGRPHQRAVAEYPQVARRQLRNEIG